MASLISSKWSFWPARGVSHRIPLSRLAAHGARMLRVSLLFVFAALGAAEVEEVTNQAQFQKILANNAAVAVDFYSTTCGPCIMIAPKYKELSKEYDGKVKFIKVNVQTAYVGIQIRMRQAVAMIARKAEAMDIEVSLGALEAFYQKYDPSKLDGIDEIYEKYPAYKLVQILKKKYGAAPEFTKKTPAKPKKVEDEGGASSKAKEIDIKKMDLEDLKAEIYRRESATEEKEMELMVKKNERRREKIIERCAAEGGAVPVKLAVVGAGPAGMTAAIYAARAGLKPVVVAPSMGGQLMSKGVNVENYPGIFEASGGDIVRLMKKQAMRFAATFEEEAALSVDLSSRPFKITTNNSVILAQSIVIATGADSRWLGVPGEDDLKGGGVSSCATCDGFLYSGKPVVVVGGGDTAMEDALVLANAVLSNPKITVMWNSTVAEFKAVEGSNVLGSVAVRSTTDETNVTEIPAEAAFVAIGHIPNTQLFNGQLEMTENGYLITKPASTKCSVDGVFAAGDVADWVYRQAVTSAGSGSSAALDAERWLSEHMVGGDADEPEEDGKEACHPEDYESWTMKQIRKELQERGVNAAEECRGCMEKSQFIEVLCRHIQA
ncbi:thioredoxin-disulfide reductase [Chrysochromulina tobinii]|uniref:Thioredoxin-disulfide reductase n=1 Tax=Chrysochromulina tobinii TaxID=1460289 RepID=A0A0M0JJY5_9EUKA|nr:thioredoxin-disulfide reductase [Chrysochromulina tobinii]|eukprot:KOO26805.1 thioredoxin-disulfide reductase [Chrysochromulina sp. CCMP291]